MKKILIGLFVLTSISAQAKICEIKSEVDFAEQKIVLRLEDKDAPQSDDSSIISNPKNLNCKGVIAEIIKSGQRTTTYEGIEIPLQLIHIINL